MDYFHDMIRQKTDYQQQRDDKYRADSKDRLTKILKKKIETTMIGALSSIEEHFGFLWNQESESMTDEQIFMKDAYQKVRSEILDKGNTQARNIDAELSQYDMKWLKYTINIPVIKQTEE
jgi:transcription termination factor Rho